MPLDTYLKRTAYKIYGLWYYTVVAAKKQHYNFSEKYQTFQSKGKNCTTKGILEF